MILCAADNTGYYLSSDFGSTWTKTIKAPIRGSWSSIAISEDAKYVILVGYDENINLITA